jgi:hypothetical protein
MDSSRITVHLPLNESPDAVLQRQQQFGVPEGESVWTDFTILGDDENTQEEPSTPDHTTSASHIPDEFISSAAQGSQDFAADKSFNPESCEIASLIPATATGETHSMVACLRNPDTDTSAMEYPTSSYTGVSRHTAVLAPLTAHTAYTTSTSSDHFSERMSDEGWGDLSKYPGKRSYGHMSSEWLESLDGWLGRSVIH